MSAILDTPQSGSNYNFQDKMEKPSNPRSVFSLSNTNTLSVPVGKTGALIPVLCFETVPTDSFEISANVLLRVLPQVVPLYSKQKIFLHAFYCRNADLWQSFNTFMTKGYSGNRVIKKPTLNSSLSSKFSDNDAVVTSSDLLHYLYSIPIGTKYKDLVGKVDALPLFMYLKIWRDYFMNKYFYTESRVLLPDDDSEFRLNTDGEIISDPNHTLDLTQWRWRDFAPDRFTSSMPSPQRGDAPTLSYSLEGWQNLILRDYHDSYSVSSSLRLNSNGIFGSSSENFSYTTSDNEEQYSLVHGTISPYHTTDAIKELSISGPLGIDLGNMDLSITLNDIRQLAISQTELEKMARTDGSYSDFGLTFFGRSSKTALDFRPIYIGGTYQPVIFTEVVQSSQSTESSALGQYAGHGISSSDGNIGSINCDDFGWIMVVASITPDTYYSQGLQKQFTRLYQADMFMPDRAKLGAQPVLNKELYFTGDVTQDDNLFAYQDIFDELRYVENSVHGKLADPSALSFFPYTQSRYFTDLPTFSQSFSTMENNVRVDYLTASNEVPYTADISFGIRAVRPLPYRAIPARII